MKIKVDRQLLLTQLSYISKAIPTKTPLPVLTGIKFVVAEEGLYLTTSDSDITINTFLPLEVNDTQVIQIDSVGSIIIPGKYFIEIDFVFSYAFGLCVFCLVCFGTWVN